MMIPEIFAAAAVMWVLQLFMTYRQSMRFNDVLKPLRAQGRVAVGLGGRYYKGGRAFVAIAEKGGEVVDARIMTGATVFAKPRELPLLKGLSLAHLASDEPIAGLKDKARSAAQMAATTLLNASETTPSE
jgi:glucitol operon activator protein